MRAHLSLNVKDVTKSVEFYKKVFGVSPQKQTDNYAKFDLEAPALNFSMQSGSKEVSRVSHLGIEVDSADDIAKWQKTLEERGLLGRPEMDTNCCYARQDKVWLTDPDGNELEIFFVHEQLPITKEKASASTCCVGSQTEEDEESCCG